MGNKVQWGDTGAFVNFVIDTVTGQPVPLTTSAGAQTTTAVPTTSGGTNAARIMSFAAGTAATSVKAGATQVYGIELSSVAAAAVYLKLYNKATAPVVGTDIPVRVIRIPAGGRVEFSRPLGTPFPLGLAYALTTGLLDTDATGVAIGDIVGSIDYA